MRFQLDPFSPTGVAVAKDAVKIIQNSNGYVGTGVRSIVAGTNVTVDATNPEKPIVSATGGGAAADATTTSKGSVKLAGDLGGTADVPLIKRTVTVTVGPVGSVADYVCDGVADDVQIQAAANYVASIGPGTVYILAGSYHISSSLSIPQYVKYQGAGMFLTRLIADSSMNTAIFSDFSYDVSSPAYFTEICDMELDGSSMAKPGWKQGYSIGRKGLEGEYWWYHVSRNLYIHDFPATGWGLDYLNRSLIDHCIIKDCGTPGVKATGTLTSNNTNVSDGDTVVIGKTPAHNSINFTTTNPSDGDTVTVDSVTYTFKNTLTATANQIKIDANPGTTASNFRNAIEAYDQFNNELGVIYSVGTTEHPTVTCPNACITTATGSNFDFYAKTTASSGDSIPTTTTSAQISFTSATLANSARTTYTFKNTLGTAYDIQIGASADASLTNLAKAINLTGLAGTDYGVGTAINTVIGAGTVTSHVLLLSSKVIGDPVTSYGNAITTTETAATLSFGAVTLTNGNRAVTQGSNGIGIGVNGMSEESWAVTNCVTIGSAHDGIMLEDLKTVNGDQTSYIVANNISLYDRYGIDTSGMDNLSVVNNNIYGCLDDGIIAFNFAHKVPTNMTMANNQIRNAGGYGIKIDDFDPSALVPQTDNRMNAVITGNVIDNVGKSGILTRGSNAVISNNIITNAKQQGIYSTGDSNLAVAISNLVISNNIISNSGQDLGSTSGYGIKLEATGTTHTNITVTGNRCFDDQTIPTQRYGIGLIGGTMSNVNLLDNNVSGNSTNGANITSTITNFVRRNNYGITNDYDMSASAKSFTGSVPTNKTAGDVTATRLMLGANTSFQGVSMDVVQEDTSTASVGKSNIYSHLSVNPGSASSTTFRGVEGVVEHKSGNTNTLSTLIGLYGNSILYGNANVSSIDGAQLTGVTVPSTSTLSGATITNVRALEATAFKISGTPPNAATITNAKGIVVQNPDAPAPIVITNSYGIDVVAQTRGSTLNVGVSIAPPSGATTNYALLLTDTGGTKDGGITFATTGNANLYRSASSTLKTDGTLLIGTPGTSTGSAVTIDGTQTLTNKRQTPRIGTTASSATPAINVDTTDQFNITALAAAITSMTSGLTGTPTDGQKLLIRIKDNGTARAITWGASFISSGTAALPTTTVISKTHLIGLIYDSVAVAWVCAASDSVGY